MLFFLETALGLWSYEYVFECVGIVVVDFAAFADTGEHLLGLRKGVRARGILKTVKKVPKSFSRNQKLMMFLYLYMRPLFHLVSIIKGRRVRSA